MTAMQQLTRRTFLASAAAVPKLIFPTRPRERLAVASYPFRAIIDTPGNFERDRRQSGVELKAFAGMVAGRFNVHAIEPLGSHFPSTDAAYLRDFRAAVEQAGSRVVNIPVSVGASLYDPDPARRETAVANAKKWVDVAVALGSPSIRVHIQRVRDTAPDVSRAAGTLQAISAYGADRGVLVNLENDDLVSEDAFFLVKVIEAVQSPDLRALPDFGNSMLKGDEQFNYDAVAAMFRHAYNIAHVKDSEIERGKVFRVDVARTFGIAKAAGYRGYFSMEWEGQGGPFEGTAHLIEETLKSI